MHPSSDPIPLPSPEEYAEARRWRRAVREAAARSWDPVYGASLDPLPELLPEELAALAGGLRSRPGWVELPS